MKLLDILVIGMASAIAYNGVLAYETKQVSPTTTIKIHKTAPRDTSLRGRMQMPELDHKPGCSITRTIDTTFTIGHCSKENLGLDLPEIIDRVWIQQWTELGNDTKLPLCIGIRPQVGEKVLVGGYPDSLRGKYRITHENVLYVTDQDIAVTGAAEHGMSGGPIVSELHQCVYGVVRERVMPYQSKMYTRGGMVYAGGTYGKFDYPEIERYALH